ncbi:GlgB N-terminal domain-containing protein, partial [Yinghuangia sp. YIM S10712]|uniref:GlgB N-terminal domain-containing protein n=1 Tax=Yinghuangia sp. YIM S10712 TaxID=3436930 RepID=UPI003F534F7C
MTPTHQVDPERPAPSVSPAAVPAAPAPPVDPGDLRRVLDARHHDPHSVLGPHPGADGNDGVVVRVLRPWAERVVVVAEGHRYELPHEAEGLFSGVLPIEKVPDYRLEVTYEGTVVASDDPYRFLPTLGEFDLHLIAEGRHEQLWTVLGAG